MAKEKAHYHHGDLKPSMIKIASKMLNEKGIESLSLRKIAENVGVSRTAAYHHFKDKNDLLCAIAAEGFKLWHQKVDAIFTNESLSVEEQFRQYFHSYIDFATKHPNTYDLMFGNIIWKEKGGSEDLKQVAYPTFDEQVNMTRYWQEQGLLSDKENPLRLAQVIWGNLHGIAKLVLDGIYTENSNIKEMCDCAINVFIGEND